MIIIFKRKTKYILDFGYLFVYLQIKIKIITTIKNYGKLFKARRAMRE